METLYLLIDTNGWVDLCGNVPEGQLDLLEYWIQKNFVSLLIPKQLTIEWAKIKEEQLKARKKTHVQISQDLGPYSRLLNGTFKYFETKSSRIDKMIHQGTQFEPTDSARIESMKHYELRKAPFHRKNNNSNSDALIYLSTVDYLRNQGITDFYFISRDNDDFSDPDDNRQLHPDLQLPDIRVHFFSSINEGLYKLGQKLGPIEAKTERDIDYVAPYILAEDLDQLSPIDQLYNSLNAYYDQLPFIPPNILARVFPFKTTSGTHSYSFYSNFRISSNNKELVKLFKSIAIDEDNNLTSIEASTPIHLEQKDKLSDILKKLNHNLIFDISSIDKTDQADIRLHQKHRCSCVQCSYQRLDFYQALRDLKTEPSSIPNETLKHAYIHFQFGHFETSLRLYYSAYENAKSQSKEILTFICLYNLKELVFYIDAYFLKPRAETMILVEKIKGISIQEHSVHYAFEAPFVRDTIKWIAEKSFYTRAFEKATQAVDEIRDHYYQQLNGGWTNSASYVKLVSAFAEIDEFLGRNCIIYNNYTQFEEIAEKLVEGVVLIYTFNEKQIPNLPSIDEYFLLKIVIHAKTDTIRKYFNRLQLISITFVHSSAQEVPFNELVVNFLSDFTKLKTLYDKTDTEKPYVFWNKYHKIFANILVALTVSDNVSDVSKITAALLDVLKEELFLKKVDNTIISNFIRVKGQYIASEHIRAMLLLAIENDRLHDPSIFSALKHQILSHHRELVIDDEPTFSEIKRHFLDKCPKCNIRHHDDVIIHVHAFLSTAFKAQVEDQLYSLLQDQFDADAYYLLAMYEVIDYRRFLNLFIERCNLPTDVQRRFAYHFTEANVEALNMILNLAFKFSIDLSDPRFEKFQGLSLYYDWLLNLDGFDYSKFNPEWVLQHQSHHFLKKVLSVSQVRFHIKEHLKTNKHEALSELYIEYES